MAKTWAKVCAAGACVLAVLVVALVRNEALTAAPKPDLKASAHWVFDVDAVSAKTVADRAGKLPATLTGDAKVVTGEGGSVSFLHLTGPDDGAMVKERAAAGAPFLPTEALSVVAWVRVDEPTEWAGVLGCFQDNGPAEAGFVVGSNLKRFFFGLATKGADDGDGKMTYLESKTEYQRGKWYHVAAVYDGKQMRLFVNGQLDATSDAQSGPVLHAKEAPLVIGRYKDRDEDFPLFGAIREVALCTHAVDAGQVAAHFAADKALAEAPPAVPEGPRFVVAPYLQYVTRTGVTVMWETDEPCTAVVEYGPTFPPKQQAKVEGANVMGEVPLAGLEPNTKYFYRVVCTDAQGRTLEGKPSTFMTAPGPNDAYSFTVIGDTQRNPVVTGKVAKLMWERRPNFVIHCGDVVDDGASKLQWTGDLFRPCAELFSRVAVFPTIGNHEKDHPYYYKYFALPKPEYYYSFTYGNAEFFVLDTNSKRNLKADGEQYKWLDRALAASTAKWKVCYHHHPAYCSDDDDYGNTWKGSSTYGDVRVRSFVTLYEKYNVDVVFNGHVHVYERSWPIRAGKVDQKNGIMYVTSGGGGGGLENFAPTPPFFKDQFRSDHHFCYVTVHQGTFKLHAFDQEGRLFDQFTIKKD
ncbi:metallophosphoesterase [Gemmata sp. JC673]|uniref:Metallophosphoesterase n=1 Tax=Gemmata algarum TaxID=2975278 RepID=A0ABU5F3M8_9BACT|nr:LamG-like jellyroll fold domain-containing protein [Gemmata algarum]MDY3561315.1 metallophosphoesterase [Gemmata algarum]